MRGSYYKISGFIDVKFKKTGHQVAFPSKTCMYKYLFDFSTYYHSVYKDVGLREHRTYRNAVMLHFFLLASKHLFASAFDSLNF